MDVEQDLQARLHAVGDRVAAAARRVGRQPEEVRLVAVSKGVAAARIAALARLGVCCFGENRVEEAEEKLPIVEALLGADAFRERRWYLVGHLQARKAARAVRRFDEIHAVDSFRLASRLDRLAGACGWALPVLLQVNVSGEEAKYGLSAGAWPEDREQTESLYAQIEAILGLEHLAVEGLMTLAPIAADPEAVRPVFRRLRELRAALAGRWPERPWKELSMGMSDDYEVAIEEGATMLRLGRAVFGPRS